MVEQQTSEFKFWISVTSQPLGPYVYPEVTGKDLEQLEFGSVSVYC